MAMQIKFTKSKLPWFLDCRFDYARDMNFTRLKEFIKRVPGSTWLDGRRVWQVPVECREMILEEARKHGYEEQ